MPIHSQGRLSMCFQRCSPSPSCGSLAAALKASWPPVSSTTLASHSSVASAPISGHRLEHAAAFTDFGEETRAAADHLAAFAVDRDHVVAVFQHHQFLRTADPRYHQFSV